VKKKATILLRITLVVDLQMLRTSRKTSLLQTMVHHSPCKSVAPQWPLVREPACRMTCRMTGLPRDAIHILRKRCSYSLPYPRLFLDGRPLGMGLADFAVFPIPLIVGGVLQNAIGTCENNTRMRRHGRRVVRTPIPPPETEVWISRCRVRVKGTRTEMDVTF